MKLKVKTMETQVNVLFNTEPSFPVQNSKIHFEPTCTDPFAEPDEELSPRIEFEFLD